MYAPGVRLWVSHSSCYRYDVPVALGSHELRLVPRPEAARVEQHRLHIDPLPYFRWDARDELGNAVIHVEFSGNTSRLFVQSELELDTRRPVAPPPSVAPLPWAMPSGDGLDWLRACAADADVRQLSDQLRNASGGEAVAFLDQVARAVHARITPSMRPEGGARPAGVTLSLGSGACRDVTLLVLELARCQGLAGRFVSGYHLPLGTPDGASFLHAWAELFLPGSGWLGWDATTGERASERHVPLFVAKNPADTLPIEGGFTFDGSVVNSTLDHSIRVGLQR